MNDCSSLQHNIPGSFCLVLKKTPSFLPLHQCDQRGRWEKFNPPTKHFLHKNDNVTKYKEKAELLVIGSRIRERDKNNAEYYVGDYYCTLVEMFFPRQIECLVTLVYRPMLTLVPKFEKPLPTFYSAQVLTVGV